jgi:predicted nucleic acid-binding Zn ribbon protein
MATYIYETIPTKKGRKPRQFEIEQKMSDPPLTRHPKTGEPVRRVITGGSGWVTHGASILSMNTRKR